MTTMMLRLSFLLLGWTLVLNLTVVSVWAKVCRIDATKDFRADPDNVYSCNDDQECCVEGGRPSCCSNKETSDEVLDQVKLWGGVIGAAVAVGILVCCCRRDSGCCEGDEICKDYLTCRCCCDSRKRGTEDDVEYERFSAPESPSRSSLSTVSHEKCEGSSFLGTGAHPSGTLDKAGSAAPSPVRQLQEIRAKDLADRLNAP